MNMRHGILLGLVLAAGLAGRAETLKFAELKSNERVVIRLVSSGCYHHSERKYVVWGGDKITVDVYRIEPAFDDGPRGAMKEVSAGAAKLSREEAAGFDAYFRATQFPPELTLNSSDAYTLEYYRGWRKIGEEKFTDLGLPELGKGATPYPWIPPAIFAAIMSPQYVERAISDAELNRRWR